MTEKGDTMALLIRDAQHSAPALDSGLIHRNWGADRDFDGMARVLNLGRDADGIAEASNGDDLSRMYARTKNFVATRDVFLVEHEQEIIAYGTCQWWIESSGKRVHRLRIEVLPMWRGCGIEETLLDRLEQHQSSLFQDHVASGLGWFELEIDVAQTWLVRVVQAAGYHVIRGFDSMVCENFDNIPDAELPAGIETRPVTSDQMRQIFWGGEDAFSDHWSSPVADEQDFALWLGQDLDTALWQIAWDGDEFVGMIRNEVNESENRKYGYRRGYTEEIAVRKAWRRRGIGKALLVRSLEMFRDMGFDSTILAVDPDNPSGAQRLYASVGYKTIRHLNFYRKQM